MPNNDLISRAVAIAEVEQWAEHGYDVIHWTGIKAMLETQPAVDAAPVVHGRWEEKLEHFGYVSCSVCHDSFITKEWILNTKWGYCPMCGAKMDGVESTCGQDYCEIGGI